MKKTICIILGILTLIALTACTDKGNVSDRSDGMIDETTTHTTTHATEDETRHTVESTHTEIETDEMETTASEEADGSRSRARIADRSRPY